MDAFSDETLMAFADDELDAATRAAVETAMRDDPEIERRVAQHRALRAMVSRAFAAQLDETPPERLLTAARGVGGAKAVDLGEARAASARLPSAAAARMRWWMPASMAASLLVGAGAGYGVLRQSQSVIATRAGWVASGSLAAALTDRLGSDESSSAVRIGLSFKSKSGDYCRTFALGTGEASGLACRHADAWRIDVMARPAGAGSGTSPGNEQRDDHRGEYRTAGSGMSPLVLNAVQEQIAGEPLDGSQEAAARERGWR